jgi:hypothetical protein
MNLDEPTIGQIDAALAEIAGAMPRALAIDVGMLDQLATLYAATYCLKLRMMK